MNQTIKVYNSLSNSIEEFKPIKEKEHENSLINIINNAEKVNEADLLNELAEELQGELDGLSEENLDEEFQNIIN